MYWDYPHIWGLFPILLETLMFEQKLKIKAKGRGGIVNTLNLCR